MKQVISWILTAAIGILCIAPLITLPTVSAAGQNQNGFDFGAYKSGTYKGRFSGGNSETHLYTGLESQDYTAYLEQLEKAGYKKYADNQVGNNRFAVYLSDKRLVNVSYSPHDASLRVTVENKSMLPGKAEENRYNGTADPFLVQVQLITEEIREGMSYVFRLADGSFLLIDGGWPEKNYAQADKLYGILDQYADGEIVIAAWIFTHAHGDHIGTFNDFIEKYSKQVTIEKLIYNFPNEEDIAHSESAYMLDSHRARLTTFKNNIRKYIPNVPVSNVHSGYRYFIRDAEVEFLFTYEDLFPLTVRDMSLNASSSVFTVTIKNQKILFLGDSAKESSDYLSAKYGGELKSDILQLAHHGYGGGTAELYSLANPQVVLWPTAETDLDSYKAAPDTAWLVANENTKEFVVFWFGTRVLKLPYTPAQNAETKFPGDPTAGNALVEPEEPDTAVTLPEPYFDLGFANGLPVDQKGHVTVKGIGGRAGDVTVHYRNKPYETTGFRAKERGDYIELRLDELSSPDQLEEMLMKGFALELFVQLEKVPSETSGFFTSCNDGGVTLYLRGKRGQMNFQLGSTQGNYSENPHYVMAAGSDLLEGTGIDAKRVAHVLGTYDPEDRMLQLYYNGVLIGQEKFTGQFRLGNAIYNKLGIGCNVSYKEEMLSDFTNYVVLGAKIYTQGLDERQVAKAYYDSLDRIGARKSGDSDAATDISAAKDGKPTSTWFIRVLLIVLGAAAVIGASIAAVIIRKKRAN